MNDRPLGYNPMRWKCADRGCYNEKHRPKIEMFAECFPGRISMGDVDGLVEINSHFFLLEWKSVAKELPRGQRLTYERLTRSAPAVVMVVTGNAETMEIESYSLFMAGTEKKKLIPASIDDVKACISRWVAWAQKDLAA